MFRRSAPIAHRRERESAVPSRGDKLKHYSHRTFYLLTDAVPKLHKLSAHT